MRRFRPNTRSTSSEHGSWRGAKALSAQTSGSVLVGVLWCLAVLSIVVIGVLHTARIDLVVVKNQGDRIQAHYLALAGVEKAKALLYHDARERSRNGVNHNGRVYSSPEDFRDVKLGRGEFRVFHRASRDEGGSINFGVTDEESRLNINTVTDQELGRLVGMTPDIIAAILDWRDSDNTVSPDGAEVDYYVSLRPPYRPRNGPFQTVRELLMVRGVTPSLLGDATSGWASIFTVDSSVQNLNAAGEERVNVQSADERTLTTVNGITADIARAIVSYRNQNRLESLADLLDVTAAQNTPQAGGGNQGARGRAPQTQSQGGGQPNSSGSKVISQQLLMDIADDITTDSSSELNGVVNINTASANVLACLPGLDLDLAQAIISFRQSSGFFPNTAWLMRVPGISQQIFKQLAPRVTARSETYRILSEGRVPSSGSRQRIEASVHVGLQSVEVRAYREDDL